MNVNQIPSKAIEFGQNALKTGETPLDAIQLAVLRAQRLLPNQHCRYRPINISGIGHAAVRTNTDDLAIAMEITAKKLYRIPPNILAKYAGRELRIVDLGANVGFASLTMLHQAQNAGAYPKIVAIEPSLLNVHALYTNVSLHPDRTKSIQIAPFAIGSTGGICNIVSPKGEAGTSTYRTGGLSQITDSPVCDTTQVLTMSEIINAYLGGQPPHVLKIDIEGAEADLFRDSSLLHGVEVLFVESHERSLNLPGSFNYAREVLAKAGFKMVEDYGTPGEEDHMYIASNT